MTTKEELEKQHSEKMNQEAIEKRKEEISKEESDRIETVFFEDDVEVQLRDGKDYRIHPCTLKDARKIMRMVKSVNIDAIILNFLPNEEGGSQDAEDDLYDLILIAFKNYKDIDRDYIDQYVDLATAREIINILLGLNGIVTKK